MIVADTNRKRAEKPRRVRRRVLLWLAGILLVGAVVWVRWVYGQIEYYATHNEARPADAIAVFGAAEYDGRPSPVLRARLQHGLNLYRKGLAPLVITLGGGYEADGNHTEGGVGKAYMLAHGVPRAAIVAETLSDDTEESVARLAAIARENNLRSIIVVSDGTHLFRVQAICRRDGLNVYTSPRAVEGSISRETQLKRLTHEILSYTAWRMHLH
jgi:uncharacterized SAM-binding protein YcdF (DUF218 family)